MLGQELTALHQGYRVRVDFRNGVPVILRQTADAVGDVEFVLPHYTGTTVAQQFIVMQQTTCNRIFDGKHANGCGILLDVLKDLFEGRAADELYLFSLEIQVCRDIVERPDQSLYGNSLHLNYYLFTFHLKTNPAFTCVKRDLVFIFLSHKLNYTQLPASQLLAK